MMFRAEMPDAPLFVVVNSETGQWVTGPLPYREAASLARLSGSLIDLEVREVAA